MKFREFLNEGFPQKQKEVKNIVNTIQFKALSIDDFDIRLDSHGIILFFDFNFDDNVSDVQLLIKTLDKTFSKVELNVNKKDPKNTHIEIKRR